MKKILSFVLLALLLCTSLFSLTACEDEIAYIATTSSDFDRYFVEGNTDRGLGTIGTYKAQCFATDALAIDAVKNGSAKYAIVTEGSFTTTEGLKAAEVPVRKENFAIAIDKEQSELLEDINAILAKMEENGTLSAIIASNKAGAGKVITTATRDPERASEQLVINVAVGYAPFSEKTDAGYMGIDIEIADYIADELGLELVLCDTEYSIVVATVGMNGVDAAIGAIVPVAVQEKFVNFSDTYHTETRLLIHHEEEINFNECEKPEDVLAALGREKPWPLFYKQFIEKEGYKEALIGLLRTIGIAVFGLVIGIILGTLIALIRVMPKDNVIAKFLNYLCTIYVGFFRGTPMVVQLLIGYFVLLPSLHISIDGMWVAVAIFGLNSGAYVSEIMRGGILSVDGGQLEAGRAVGLPFWTAMLKIVIPQSIKNILPTLGNEFIVLIKETSVVSFIAVVDITKAFRAIGDANYEYVIPYLMLAAVYLVLVIGISAGVKSLEKRMAKNERSR